MSRKSKHADIFRDKDKLKNLIEGYIAVNWDAGEEELKAVFCINSDSDARKAYHVAMSELRKEGALPSVVGTRARPGLVKAVGHYVQLNEKACFVMLEKPIFGYAKWKLDCRAGYAFPSDRIEVLLDKDNADYAKYLKRIPVAEFSRRLESEGSFFGEFHRSKKGKCSLMIGNCFFPLDNVPYDLENKTWVEARAVEGKELRARFVKSIARFDAIETQENLTRLSHDVPREFPPLVIEESEKLPAVPTEADFVGRRDLRSLPFVTIDGETAKDFDDAIQIEKEKDGSFVLRVAIADVSHYVRPYTALDKEALERGNSWYFPTSVNPMLPEALSCELCSLKPGVDRLVVWVEMPFTSEGRRLDPSFGTGVIRSAARLTYERVNNMLVKKDRESIAAFRKENLRADEILSMLEDAFDLLHLLRPLRKEDGWLDFNLPDTVALFTPEGKLQTLSRDYGTEANKLIEHFMVSANEAVAQKLEKQKIETLFRVHPAPTEEKMGQLAATLSSMGIVELTRKKHEKKALNIGRICTDVQGTAVAETVNRLCVRAMEQARYDKTNIGHYGLGLDSYCHFTSPIRRYADLLVHRALKQALGCDNAVYPIGNKLSQIADHINFQERKAMEAEREMNKRLACLWIAQQSGRKVWNAHIVSVHNFGAFVALDECPVEGLISIENLASKGSSCSWRYEHEWICYDERRQRLVGEESGKVWTIGKSMQVICIRSDIESLQIDFIPAVGSRH